MRVGATGVAFDPVVAPRPRHYDSPPAIVARRLHRKFFDREESMLKTQSPLLSALAVASLSAVLLAADAPTSQPTAEKRSTPSGLTIMERGADDTVAAAGDKVWVEYTGKLTDGTKFDSSADHPEQPFLFTLGKRQVIAGWDEGIAGMKVGQKRQLLIPPNLAYGSQSVGNIPPNSTLVFDVKLLGVMKGQ